MIKSVYIYVSLLVINSHIFSAQNSPDERRFGTLAIAHILETPRCSTDSVRNPDGTYNLLGGAQSHLLTADNHPLEEGENPEERHPVHRLHSGDIIVTEQSTALHPGYNTHYTVQGANVVTIHDGDYNHHLLHRGTATVVSTTTNVVERKDGVTTVRKEVTKDPIVVHPKK